MNIYQFMSESPFLTFFLFLIVGQCVICVVKYPMRHLNIRSKGWPPPHLDADGDFKDKGYDPS